MERDSFPETIIFIKHLGKSQLKQTSHISTVAGLEGVNDTYIFTFQEEISFGSSTEPCQRFHV